ncbi:unnamed protein product [Effrenium voratum]|nr:unnamed protein product [Effrenium voratum]
MNEGIGERGLFTSRPVKAGELLLVSRPIASAERNGAPLIAELRRKCAVSGRAKKRLQCLAGGGGAALSPEVVTEALFNCTDTLASVPQGQASEGDLNLTEILNHNVFTVDPGFAALYGLPSMLNHSCDGRGASAMKLVLVFFDKAMIFTATRDLEAGEELCHRYFDVEGSLVDRQGESRKWGFACACRRCSFEAQQLPGTPIGAAVDSALAEFRGELRFEMPWPRLRQALVPQLSTRAGFTLSQLGVGTWQWGNKLLWGYDPQQDGQLEEVFDAFTSGGANWFDTGDSYGTGELEGRAEILLGRFARKVEDREENRPILATKLAAYPWRLTPESMVEAVQQSEKRMGRVDVAQMHWSPRSYGFGFQEDALLEGLCRCYEAGLCRGVGLSNFGPRNLRRAAAIFDARSVPLVLNQVQYSLLSVERESGVAEVCKELGVRLVAYSPLCLGVLGGRYKADATGRQLPGNFLRSFLSSTLLSDKNTQDLLALMGEIAAARGKTVAQVALNFALTEGGGCAIVGARGRGQAEENLGACGWALEDGELRALAEAARKAPKTQKNAFFSD